MAQSMRCRPSQECAVQCCFMRPYKSQIVVFVLPLAKQLGGTVHRTVSVLPGQVGVIQVIGVLLECCWECSTWLMCTAVQRCCCTASCSLLSGVLLNDSGRVLLVCADFLLALRSVVILSHHLVTSAPHLPSCYKLSTF